MKTTNPFDVARIELLLSDLRLPAIKQMWKTLAEQADKEGWPAARFLAALAAFARQAHSKSASQQATSCGREPRRIRGAFSSAWSAPTRFSSF